MTATATRRALVQQNGCRRVVFAVARGHVDGQRCSPEMAATRLLWAALCSGSAGASALAAAGSGRSVVIAQGHGRNDELSAFSKGGAPSH